MSREMEVIDSSIPIKLLRIFFTSVVKRCDFRFSLYESVPMHFIALKCPPQSRGCMGGVGRKMITKSREVSVLRSLPALDNERWWWW